MSVKPGATVIQGIDQLFDITIFAVRAHCTALLSLFSCIFTKFYYSVKGAKNVWTCHDLCLSSLVSSLKDNLTPRFTVGTFPPPCSHVLRSFLTTSLHLVLGLPVGSEPGIVLKRAFLGVLESSIRLTCRSHLSTNKQTEFWNKHNTS